MLSRRHQSQLSFANTCFSYSNRNYFFEISFMIYLRSIQHKESECPQGFPLDIPCIKSLGELIFSSPVSFLVGENGCGKSTLIEAIACWLQSPAIGSADVSQDESLESQRMLADYLKFIRLGTPKVKLFFRAEDSFGFTKKINNLLQDLSGMEEEF